MLSSPIALPLPSGRTTRRHTTISATRYATLGETDEAIAAYRRAVAIKPDFPEAHYNLGNALVALGQDRRGRCRLPPCHCHQTGLC